MRMLFVLKKIPNYYYYYHVSLKIAKTPFYILFNLSGTKSTGTLQNLFVIFILQKLIS